MEYPSYGTPPAGSIRFNTDSKKMEIYNGDKWWDIDSTSPDAQTGGCRGLFGGGESPKTDTIDYINMASTGDATDFGNLIADNSNPGSLGGKTRGFWVGGETPSIVNTIQYVDFDRTSNATDYADLAQAVRRIANSALSNSTRGIVGGGYDGSNNVNNIQYFTISSNANAVDFGDLLSTLTYSQGAASPTRGLWLNGEVPTPAANTPSNVIQYVTISTTGNSSDFGDMTTTSSTRGGCSNAIRAVGFGGKNPSAINTIDYFNIPTLGNAIDFGDLDSSRANGTAIASSIRGVYGGGADTIEYITFSTTGNAVDFGNRSVNTSYLAGCSNGHGGLG